MSIAISQKTKSNDSRKTVVVSKKVKSHAKDPFFVSKAKAAEAFLNKHGLPAGFSK